MGQAEKVSLDLMNLVWPMPLPSVQKFVLLALADRADDDGKKCFPSVKWIMERTSLSERTVQRAICWLSDNGHLTVGEKPGHSSSYLLHPRQSDTPSPVNAARASDSHPRQSDVPPPSDRRGTPVTVTPHPRQSDTHIPPGSLLDPSVIHHAPKKLAKRPKSERASMMPPSYDAEHMRGWTKEHCPGVDFDLEMRMLRDHEFKTPKCHWDAVVRTWMTRAVKYSSQAVNGSNGRSFQPDPPQPVRRFGQ